MLLEHTTKGIPPYACVDVQAIAHQRWNLLHEDLDLPVCILDRSALENNLAWMQSLVDDKGALFAPHGKTTMSPELFQMQVKAGAWAITLATGHQVRVARAFGIQRIFYANQLVGGPLIRYIIQEMQADPGFEFIFLVDNEQNIQAIEAQAQAMGLDRRLQVLVELGYPGGRCGCRTADEALALAARVAASPVLDLIGIEGFEGYIHAGPGESQAALIRAFLQSMVDLMHACHEAGHFAPGQTLFSVGGSAFYDLVFDETDVGTLPAGTRVLTRSGCYLTHDAGLYQRYFSEIMARNPAIGQRGHGLLNALEVWGYVLSRPERERIIVNAGKRDISPDDLPVVLGMVRFGESATGPLPLPGHSVVDLNDQHTHIRCPADSPVQAGDAILLGMSHPCLTFDKWRRILVRNDAHDIVGAISTWF